MHISLRSLPILLAGLREALVAQDGVTRRVGGHLLVIICIYLTRIVVENYQRELRFLRKPTECSVQEKKS